MEFEPGAFWGTIKLCICGESSFPLLPFESRRRACVEPQVALFFSWCDVSMSELWVHGFCSAILRRTCAALGDVNQLNMWGSGLVDLEDPTRLPPREPAGSAGRGGRGPISDSARWSHLVSTLDQRLSDWELDPSRMSSQQYLGWGTPVTAREHARRCHVRGPGSAFGRCVRSSVASLPSLPFRRLRSQWFP